MLHKTYKNKPADTYSMSGSVGIPKRIIESIDAYIAAHYVPEDINDNPDEKNEEAGQFRISDTVTMIPIITRFPIQNIEKQLAGNGATFHDKLFEHIRNSGMDNKEVWRRANMDRKHFSKLRCDENCKPKKKTVMSLCVALKLNLEQSKDLMSRAGWAFNPSSKFDLIVAWAIEQKEYDILLLNNILYRYTEETLSI